MIFISEMYLTSSNESVWQALADENQLGNHGDMVILCFFQMLLLIDNNVDSGLAFKVFSTMRQSMIRSVLTWRS